MTMKPEPIVTVIRPVLTSEEREKRIEAVKDAMVKFWTAKIRMEKEKEKRNV
jgi:hypothetical protein